MNYDEWVPIPKWKVRRNKLLRLLPWRRCMVCRRRFRVRWRNQYLRCWIRYGLPEYCSLKCCREESDYLFGGR